MNAIPLYTPPEKPIPVVGPFIGSCLEILADPFKRNPILIIEAIEALRLILKPSSGKGWDSPGGSD